MYIGLDNKECKTPKYYCKSHNIYLSEEDVNKKKCLCKLTPDMISERKCNWLMTIQEYEYEKETTNERVKIAKENYRAEKIFRKT